MAAMSRAIWPIPVERRASHIKNSDDTTIAMTPKPCTYRSENRSNGTHCSHSTPGP